MWIRCAFCDSAFKNEPASVMKAVSSRVLWQEAVPFAVVGSSTVIEIRGRKVRGRMYPWGVVEVENPDHCDFIKLRTMLM